MMIERLSAIRPGCALDIGCGCGSFTAKLSPFCGRLEAVDPMAGIIERCRREQGRPNITYRVMDGADLQYPARSFDAVLERASLHHIADWRKAVDEMARVSRGYVLIEEPVPDPRSSGKRSAEKAQELLLELQREVKWPHFPHIAVSDLLAFLNSRKLKVRHELIRSDKPVSFAEFFTGFDHFAGKSGRPGYWNGRLKDFQAELGGGTLTESDTVFIEAAV